MRLTVVACTRTTISPGPGTGSGTSSKRTTSGPPYRVRTAARIGPAPQRPRSLPMSSFMISFEPAQIFVTRASRHARATRYSFMKP